MVGWGGSGVEGKMSVGVHPSESLSGAGGSASKWPVHSHGCGLEASVPHHVDISLGLFECPQT